MDTKDLLKSNTATTQLDKGATDRADEFAYAFKSEKGLSREVVEMISRKKNEPDWMLQNRLKALEIFYSKPMPNWGADLSGIDFDAIHYYVTPTEKSAEKTWEEVPAEIKKTYERLGIPQAEQEMLAGVGAQYESEMIYHSLKEDLEKQGVIFSDVETATREHPELVRQYFGRVIPAHDNKFAALNTAVWSGGSFIYIPKGVHVEIPLQAYFRINLENMGQFERTLIIADEGSFVHYIEGCSAPSYSSHSLHSAVVEIIVKKGARVRYTTIQNWATNIYNLVTKRMVVDEDGVGEWIDGNIGSYVTMKYPSVFLRGKGARGDILSLAVAGSGQNLDTGGKAIHLAPNTTSSIVSKSISKNGGRSSYRGLVQIFPGMKGCKSNVRCDALILDSKSRSDTYPTMDIREQDVSVSHEATVSKIGEEQLFYLQTRGLDKASSEAMIVNGFIEPIIKELPMEYAMELNNLIQMEMEDSVG